MIKLSGHNISTWVGAREQAMLLVILVVTFEDSAIGISGLTCTEAYILLKVSFEQ